MHLTPAPIPPRVKGGVPFVLLRAVAAKVCQSERGERTIERLLSVSVTCRLQERSLFAYLSDVLTASIRGDPIPALA